MLGTLGQYLKKNQKSKLWRDAYIYQVAKESLQKFILSHFEEGKINPQILDNKIIIKEERNTLKITISAGNTSFCSWLKTNLLDIENLFRQNLEEKKLITEEAKLKISFKIK